MPVLTIRRDETTAEFFAATSRGELPIRRCHDCGHDNPPQDGACGACHSSALDWTPAAGHGTVVSWSVIHGRARDNEPAPRTVVAIVELAEGPWLHAQLIDVDPGEVSAGLPVTVAFERPEGGEAIPVFRPVAG